MPKKKNRSNRQAKQHRQAKALAVRQDKKVDAILEATHEALPAVLAAGQLRVRNEDGVEYQVTLEQIQERVNTDLVPDGEPPIDEVSEVVDMLRDEVSMGLVYLQPDGVWRLPPDYLPGPPAP